MNSHLLRAFSQNFMGQAPRRYKQTVIAFLIVNLFLLYTVGPFVTGRVLIGEFIFALAMAWKSYPL